MNTMGVYPDSFQETLARMKKEGEIDEGLYKVLNRALLETRSGCLFLESPAKRARRDANILRAISKVLKSEAGIRVDYHKAMFLAAQIDSVVETTDATYGREPR